MGGLRGAVTWGAALAVVVGSAVLVGGHRDDSLDEVRRRGTVRIGYAVEPPYALLGPRGEVTGESPETARLVVAALGLGPPAWVQMSFEELIPALERGRIDVIAAGMFVTPERAQRVRFSAPTVYVRPALLTRREQAWPDDVLSAAPASGLRVAVVSASVEQVRWQARGFSGGQLLVVPDAQAGVAATLHGLADGLALSLPALRVLAARSGGALEVHTSDARAAHVDRIAFAFRRDAGALADAWDHAQAGVVGGAAHRAAVAPFGFGPEDLPAPSSHRADLDARR